MMKHGAYWPPIGASQRAFPNYRMSPTCAFQSQKHLCIVRLIIFKLLGPEQRVRSWADTQWAFMAMPEASVDKQDCPRSGKNKVRSAWQRTIMQTVAEPERMQAAPHDDLWAGNSEVMQHTLCAERGWMSGNALFIAAQFRHVRAPLVSLALLICHECSQRRDLHDPQILEALAVDEAASREARYVVRSQAHAACGVA